MIKHVTYKEKKYPVCISFYALRQLENEGLELGDENSKNNYQAIERLFWHALRAGHHHEDKNLLIEESEVAFMLDFCFKEFQQLMPLFLEQLAAEKKQAKKQT